MKAAVFYEFGPPEVIRFENLELPKMGPDEVLIGTRAIGLNYADIYRRRGEYQVLPPSPFILGYEGAGVVESVGRQVRGVAIGDRVAFVDVPRANAEFVVAPFEKVIPLPNEISFETAAGSLLQGLTAQYLTETTHSIENGETVLVHAAAGGVGLFLLQMAKLGGARTIAVISSAKKMEVVRSAGADEVIVTSELDLENAVCSITHQKGVDVVYDGVGSTLATSLAVTRRYGHVVFYGWSGGNPQIDPRLLMNGSKKLSGGDLWDHLTSRELRVRKANALFDSLREGKLKAVIHEKFPLSETGAAHRLLESRQTTGKILLIP